MGACPLTEPEALCSGFEERGLRVKKKGKLQRQRQPWGRRQGALAEYNPIVVVVVVARLKLHIKFLYVL